MPHIELPHIITVGMDEDSFRVAVQQNLDHLANTLKLTFHEIDERVNDTSVIEDVIHSTASEGSDSALRQVLADAGVGDEDGVAPPTPGNLRAQGGIGDWFVVLWDGVTNTSPTNYKVYADTISGFSASPSTLVGTFRIPGGDKALGSLLVKQFPSGHRIAGQQVNSATTYFVRVAAEDASGESAPTGQVQVTPLKVDANTVIAAGTIVGNLIAGQTVVADHISSIHLTTIQAVVGTLSAITANLGTVNAGVINGLTITGGTITGTQIRTAGSGGRIELGWGANLQRLELFNTSGVGVFNVNAGSDNNAFLGNPAAGGKIIVQLGTLRWDNPPQWGNVNDINSDPGVGAGVGQTLPARPAVYFKVLTQGGNVRWIPGY